MWKLIKDILFALLAYWRERQKQQKAERQRRQADLMARDREIAGEVEHAKQETEQFLAEAGRDAHAYRRAFERLRHLQQDD